MTAPDRPEPGDTDRQTAALLRDLRAFDQPDSAAAVLMLDRVLADVRAQEGNRYNELRAAIVDTRKVMLHNSEHHHARAEGEDYRAGLADGYDAAADRLRAVLDQHGGRR